MSRRQLSGYGLPSHGKQQAVRESCILQDRLVSEYNCSFCSIQATRCLCAHDAKIAYVSLFSGRLRCQETALNL